MSKKVAGTTSQLLMFSNTFHSEAENWFAGNVIIEYDLEAKHATYGKEIAQVVNFLRITRKIEYTKVTAVLNHNEQGLTLALLSGYYPYMCKLTTSADYLALNALYKQLQQVTLGIHYLEALERTEKKLKLAKKYSSQAVSTNIKAVHDQRDQLQTAYMDLQNSLLERFEAFFMCGHHI